MNKSLSLYASGHVVLSPQAMHKMGLREGDRVSFLRTQSDHWFVVAHPEGLAIFRNKSQYRVTCKAVVTHFRRLHGKSNAAP